MKKVALCVSSILLFTGMLLSVAVYGEPRGIEVSGTGVVKAVPNIVHFNFSIKENGKQVARLRSKVDSQSEELIEFAKQIGVLEKDITSLELSIYPRHNYKENLIEGYDVTRNIRITLRDLGKYSKLLNGAIKAGVTIVGGVQRDIDNREALRNRALEKAIQAATKKAALIANSAGVSLGNVVNIREDIGSYEPQPLYQRSSMVLMDNSEEQGSVVSAGELSIKANVRMQFNIK